MPKPSIIIKEKKKDLRDNDGLSERDAEFKAILWYLNQEYFKKPTNDEKDYNV